MHAIDKEEITETQTNKGTHKQKTLDGREIGLQLITKQSVGFPETNFSPRDPTKGLLRGTFKWTYT